MKRILLVLVAGTVLIGAGAPMATAVDEARPPKTNIRLEAEATPSDWLELGRELAELRRAIRAAEVALDAGVWRERECRFQSLRQGAWTALEERLTSECVLRKWQVSGGYPFFYSVGACESGWNRFASNGGRYLGLFQHAASYWRGRVRNLTPAHWSLAPSWTNSRTQITVTARMVHYGGWGPWSCA